MDVLSVDILQYRAALAHLMEQENTSKPLAACSHWIVDQCRYVLGALYYRSRHADHQPYAVHLEVVRTSHRNLSDYRNLFPVPAVLSGCLTPHTFDSGLGGAGGANDAFAAQSG